MKAARKEDRRFVVEFSTRAVRSANAAHALHLAIDAMLGGEPFLAKVTDVGRGETKRFRCEAPGSQKAIRDIAGALDGLTEKVVKALFGHWRPAPEPVRASRRTRRPPRTMRRAAKKRARR